MKMPNLFPAAFLVVVTPLAVLGESQTTTMAGDNDILDPITKPCGCGISHGFLEAQARFCHGLLNVESARNGPEKLLGTATGKTAESVSDFVAFRVDDREIESSGQGSGGGDQRAAGDCGKWAAALGLETVPDIGVETWMGHLPHLPCFLPGQYRGDGHGPPVRVIWPAPADNARVREPREYTVTGTVPGTALRPQAKVTVRKSNATLAAPQTMGGEDLASASGLVLANRTNATLGPQLELEPFALGDVVLDRDVRGRKTPFMENRDKFVEGLAATSADRFLYMFRDAFGQPQPDGAEPLGVWDSRTCRLRGHATGHYLTALAQACAGAANAKPTRRVLREKLAYCIDTLYDLSRKTGRPVEKGEPFVADPRSVPPGPGRDGYDSDLSEEGIRTDYWNWGEGFISAYPPDQFIMLEKGATYGQGNDQVWAPYYTLDKILKGLLDCYELTGNEKALAVARGMGLWVHRRLKRIPQATLTDMWNRYIAGEYGGMNADMARLHAITGDQRFLETARMFDNVAFFYGGANHPHGLARNVDTIRGRHANQHIPQIIGALRVYGRTGEPDYYRIAENFWNLSRHGYAYSIGGVAGARDPENPECYTAEPDHLCAKGFSEDGQNETCATYNMLRLTRELFMYHPHGRYMDYYEQALYNHILASVARDDAGNTYHVPLNPGARKNFSNADMTGFTCCNGTAMDSNTKLQDSIYFRSRDNSALYVNLYIPSTLTWRERDVRLRQSTRYPYGETTRLTIKGAGRFVLHLRIPGWLRRDYRVIVNGEQRAAHAEPGSYLSLQRNWADGDIIELHMPFDFHLQRVMDCPDLASLFHGPVLLAVEETTALADWRRVTLDALNPGASIAGDPSLLRFQANGLNWKPFFDFNTERHSVYVRVEPP
ncbi:MAG: glycoside hydrolase family 127 protein [Planctomycetota bacterium]